MGMDPAIGFLHVDTPNRDSLACDLMEVCRPSGVDAFVLNWLQSEPLRKLDFWEDGNGNCRIASSLAIKLCETSNTWRKLVAPVVEYVAQEIWSSTSKQTSKTKLTQPLIATRLTQRNKREGKGAPPLPSSIRAPRRDNVCRGCGKAIRDRSTTCVSCSLGDATKNMLDAARIGRQTANGPEAQLNYFVAGSRLSSNRIVSHVQPRLVTYLSNTVCAVSRLTFTTCAVTSGVYCKRHVTVAPSPLSK